MIWTRSGRFPAHTLGNPSNYTQRQVNAHFGPRRILLAFFTFTYFSFGAVLADNHLPTVGAVYKNAYATILYVGTPRDSEFFLATRVLLQSLARLNVDADLVVIASKNVPQEWAQTFANEGVRVILVENIHNPYAQQHLFNHRFIFTLNKLYAWSLTEYERVVMLDVDNLFMQKTDELFQCGQFCAAFIDPCIFHTGLFVLEPSTEVFEDMRQQLRMGKENRDGADQGFLTSYFSDLLDKPMFHPPNNGSRLSGHYRLPFGYQMDASYYYLRLKWRVPCGPNSVVTFPGASWLKPWYWWSWPVLPLGLSWHNQRQSTIGYGAESPLLIAEAIFYAATLIIAFTLWRGFPPAERKPIVRFFFPRYLGPDFGVFFQNYVTKILALVCIIGSFLLPLFMVPTTTHPVAGWGLSLLGSLSLLMVTVSVFQLPIIPVMTPWILSFGILLVMASPYYRNGISRGLSILTFTGCATPFLWRSLTVIIGSRDTYTERECSKASTSPSILLKLC